MSYIPSCELNLPPRRSATSKNLSSGLPTQMWLAVIRSISALTACTDLTVEGKLFSRSQDCGDMIQLLTLKVHVKSSWITTDSCTSWEIWFGWSVKWESINPPDRPPKGAWTQDGDNTFSATSRDCNEARFGAGAVARQSSGRDTVKEVHCSDSKPTKLEREMSCNCMETTSDVTAHFFLSSFFQTIHLNFLLPILHLQSIENVMLLM